MDGRITTSAACNGMALPAMVAVGVLTACGTAPGEERSRGFGRVWIGPTCPVVKESEECANEPYLARLEVRDAGGSWVAQQHSDESGFFRTPRPREERVLLPEVAECGGPSRAGPMVFDPREGTRTVLTVSYDSGIR